MNLKNIIFMISITLMVAGCSSSTKHTQNLTSSNEREMTVGIVQKEIRKGLSQADVATSLGSPNIVTSDGDGKETWIYDKIASEASFSKDSGGVFLLLGWKDSESGAASTTQKTLTVIIKFANNAVDTFSYHSSKF